MREQARRERMIGVKVTEEEYERFRVRAFEARKSIGAFVRDLVLGAGQGGASGRSEARKRTK